MSANRNEKHSVVVNKIYCGDCTEITHRYIPDESVDLIYVDPPFFSNKQYEILWGNGYELRAFEDRWKGGIENYIAWMEPKVTECWRILKSTGAMYLHCDWHAAHYLKLMMDRIFGINNFRNEIIVKRTTRKNIRERKKVKKMNVGCDTLLFYAKTKEHLIIPPTIKTEKKAAYWHAFDAPEIRSHLEYELFGKKPPEGCHWRWTKEKAMGAIKEEKLRPNPKTGRPEYLVPEREEVVLSTIWNDINAYSFKYKYPTEKNEKFMDRIIETSSNATDIVLDPMLGGGTTLASAQRLGRRWIGIDVSPTACKITVKRLKKQMTISENDIIGLPKTIKELKRMQPFEFQNWIIQKLMGRVSRRRVGDFGIDGWTFDARPIQVKQSVDVGRNVIDNFETAMRRRKKTKGIIVAFNFGKGAYEETARAKNQEGLEIELKKVEDLIEEI